MSDQDEIKRLRTMLEQIASGDETIAAAWRALPNPPQQLLGQADVEERQARWIRKELAKG